MLLYNCAPSLSRAHDTKIVLCKVHRRLSRRGVDLILILTPLRIIDAIDPLLGLNHQTSELRHIRGTIPMLLAHLDGDGAIEVVTRVELQTLLVGIDVQLDTSDVGVHGEHADVCSFWRGVPGPVEDECIVVAGAVKAAVTDCVKDVSADLFWGGEIEGRAIDYADCTVGYLDIVNLYVTRRVGHVQCVVQDCQV